MTDIRHVLFLLGSSRADGQGGSNSEALARVAAQGLPQAVRQTWIALRDMPAEPFVDVRHSVGTYPPATGNARRLLDATLAASDIVVAMPLHWYGPPARVQAYLEQWSAWMRVPGLDFKAAMARKTLWLLLTQSGEPHKAQPAQDAMRYTAEFLNMRFGGAVVSRALKPGDVMQDAAALQQAAALLG
ncbi:MAG: NAD(P)H-dependent oxidoreductase [Betaproteobacteria bacterium]|nr:NAD(P)H-dependent oxidoreductase [Betaproteobacteria bacterium]MDE2046992.1 NAD(P)H-dependent oxidoreductase [Betaproteobacteria bacterium]